LLPREIASLMGRAGAAAGRAGEEEVKVYDLIDLSDEPDLVDMETWVLELVVVREVKAEPSGDDDNRGGSLPQAVKEEEGEEAREDNLMEDVPMPDGDGDGLGASSYEEEEGEEEEEEEEEDMEWTGLVLFPLLTEAEDEDEDADSDYEEEESEDEAEWEAADWLAAEQLDEALFEEEREEEYEMEMAMEESGPPPLADAIQEGDVAAVKALLAAGADADGAGMAYGFWTPLYQAAQEGHVEVVEALLAAGAAVDPGMKYGAGPYNCSLFQLNYTRSSLTPSTSKRVPQS